MILCKYAIILNKIIKRYRISTALANRSVLDVSQTDLSVIVIIQWITSPCLMNRQLVFILRRLCGLDDTLADPIVGF